jgi:FKBP-type peptidyl-prolyl cis-trans isomerase FklB
MRYMFLIILSLIQPLSVCLAGERTALRDGKTMESYSLGYEYGDHLRRQHMELDVDILLMAIREALEGSKPAISPEEIRNTLLQLRKKVIILQDRRVREQAEKNLEMEKAFLAANKGRDGVKTLPSGLQYKVLREGKGAVPQTGDMVMVNYRGILIDGTEFDSSYGRGEPSTIPVNGGIRGWREALQLMKVGAKWQIIIPSGLAYGGRQFGRIPPNSTLIFEVELLSVEKNADPSGTLHGS